MATYKVTIYTKGGNKITEEVSASSSHQAMSIAKARYPDGYSISGAQRISN